MSSTPLISCSSGVATVWATVSADAPGYDAVTFTVGGTISGYCATGRIVSAPRPNKVTKMLSTVAKRGRSMKKCVRRMSSSSVLVVALRSGVADRALLWCDFRPRSGVGDAVYDHFVIWRQAGPDDAQAAADVADLDLLGHDGAIR